MTKIASFSTGYDLGDRQQASHWKDSLGLGALDPTAKSGELLIFTDLDAIGFDVIGWNLASGVSNIATPTIQSLATVNYSENGVGTAYTVIAADADAASTFTFALGGADATKFSINSSTGVVKFLASPNYESPTDVGGNYVYDITVTASDGVHTSPAKAVAITVTNVGEAGDTSIDLGAYGKLIAPVQVDGGKWYYYCDLSGNGTSANSGALNGGVDYTTHDLLDAIFNQDINGLIGGGGNTTDTYRYLKLTTIGGVLRAGDELMQISPTEGEMVFEVKVNPADIGQLSAGLPVSIKLDAFDYSVYGSLEGKLTYLSSDTLPRGADVCMHNAAGGQASDKPRGRKPRDEPVKPGRTTTLWGFEQPHGCASRRCSKPMGPQQCLDARSRR